MQTLMSAALADWGLIMADDIATCLPNGNESYDLRYILDGLDDLEAEVEQVPAVQKEECKKIVHGRGKEITRVKRMIQSPKEIVHGRGKEIAHVKGIHRSPEPEPEPDSEKRTTPPTMMTEESYQAKLEATKRKLHQGYQGYLEGRKKTKILDLKDIPVPSTTPRGDTRRRSVNFNRCYKQFPKINRAICGA